MQRVCNATLPPKFAEDQSKFGGGIFLLHYATPLLDATVQETTSRRAIPIDLAMELFPPKRLRFLLVGVEQAPFMA